MRGSYQFGGGKEYRQIPVVSNMDERNCFRFLKSDVASSIMTADSKNASSFPVFPFVRFVKFVDLKILSFFVYLITYLVLQVRGQTLLEPLRLLEMC